MVPGRTGGYSSEMDIGRKCVQLLVLLTFVMTCVVAVPNTTVTSPTANTTTRRNATNPPSKTTTDTAISDNPATSPSRDLSTTKIDYVVQDPETGKACFWVATSISIKANYISTDYDIKETFLTIPPTGKIRGTCRGVAPTMELIWAEDPTLEGTENRITLMIGSKHITFSLHVVAFDLYIDEKNFPDAKEKGKRFQCEQPGLDEVAESTKNGPYRCKPEITANTVDVDITFPLGFSLGRASTWGTVTTGTEENDVSGAVMTQWSGYLLVMAQILIFLKLGH